MRFTNKAVGSGIMAAVMAFSFSLCHADCPEGQNASVAGQQFVAEQSQIKAVKKYKNHGLRLSVPKQYDKLLVVETPKDGAKLFTVSEKKSIEVDKAQGGSGEGAGWLFSIGSISEIQLYEMLKNDMSGVEVFAKDADGTYYVYYHPTDVRVIREDYTKEESFKDWAQLNQWADGMVRERFVADNKGFTAEKFGNADLDIYLARAAFDDSAEYTVSTSECCPWYPTVVNLAPYVMPLIHNAQVEALNSTTAPEGDYVVLNFPKDNIRFDFFLAEGSENIYRQTWSDGMEQLFRINFADSSIKASKVMKEWFDALAAAAE